jgi:hypothetical protein
LLRFLFVSAVHGSTESTELGDPVETGTGSASRQPVRGSDRLARLAPPRRRLQRGVDEGVVDRVDRDARRHDLVDAVEDRRAA